MTMPLPSWVALAGPNAIPTTKCTTTLNWVFSHNSTTYLYSGTGPSAVSCAGTTLTPLLHVYITNVTGSYNEKEITASGTTTRGSASAYVLNQILFSITSTGTPSNCDTANTPIVCSGVQFGSTAFNWPQIAGASYNNATKVLTASSPASTSATTAYVFDPLAIDGSAGGGSNSGTGQSANYQGTLTTANSPDVILMFLASGTCKTKVSSVADSPSGLTWHKRGEWWLTGGGYGNKCIYVAEYYAVASGTLSSDTVTATMNASSYARIYANGISGADTSTIFDSHSGLPAEAQGSAFNCGTGCTVTFSTSNANDFIEAALGADTGLGALAAGNIAGSAATTIKSESGGSASINGEYRVVSSAETSQTAAFGGTSTADYIMVADAIMQASSGVTQGIQVTVANGGTSGTSFSLSGCGTGSDPNSTFTADGYTHTYTSVTASCSITVTVKTDASYTRYRFGDLHPSTAVKTWVFTSCSSGSCTNSNTTYYQFLASYTCSPSSPSTFDGIYACTATGTFVGVGSTTIGTVNTANGGGAVTVSSVWADYDKPVSLPVTLSAWGLNGGTYSWTDTTDTSGNSHTASYYLLNLADTDTFTFSDSPARTASLLRSYSDTLSFSDSPSRLITLGRSFSDMFPFLPGGIGSEVSVSSPASSSAPMTSLDTFQGMLWGLDNGRYWYVYPDGTNWSFVTSTSSSPSSWSSPSLFRTGGGSTTTTWGSPMSVWMNATTDKIYYAYADMSTDAFSVRSGTLNSGGTITWDSTEVAVSTAGTNAYYDVYPSTTLSNGVWYVSYGQILCLYPEGYWCASSSSTSYLNVWSCSSSCGTAGSWGSVYTSEVSTSIATSAPSSVLRPLTGGKIVMVYSPKGDIFQQLEITTCPASCTSISSWATAVATTSLYDEGMGNFVSVGTTLYSVDVSNSEATCSTGAATCYVKYWSFTYPNNGGSAPTETTLHTFTSGDYVSSNIATDGTNLYASYLLFANNQTTIYTRLLTTGGSSGAEAYYVNSGECYTANGCILNLVSNMYIMGGGYLAVNWNVGGPSSFTYEIEFFSISSGFTRLVALGRTLSDTLAFSTVETRLVSLQRAFSGSFSFSTVESRLASFSRTLADSLPFSAVDSRLISLQRGIVDSFPFSTVESRLVSLQRSVTDTFAFSVSEAASAIIRILLTFADTFNFSNVPSRLVSLGRTLTDSFPFSTVETRLASLQESIADTFAFASSPSRLVGLARSFADSLPFSDLPAHMVDLPRTFADALPFSTSYSRLVALERAVSDAFPFSSTDARLVSLGRAFSDVFPFSVSNALSATLVVIVVLIVTVIHAIVTHPVVVYVVPVAVHIWNVVVAVIRTVIHILFG